MYKCIGFFNHLYKLLGKQGRINKGGSKRYHQYMGKFLRYLGATLSGITLPIVSINNLNSSSDVYCHLSIKRHDYFLYIFYQLSFIFVIMLKRLQYLKITITKSLKLFYFQILDIIICVALLQTLKRRNHKLDTIIEHNNTYIFKAVYNIQLIPNVTIFI